MIRKKAITQKKKKNNHNYFKENIIKNFIIKKEGEKEKYLKPVKVIFNNYMIIRERNKGING